MDFYYLELIIKIDKGKYLTERYEVKTFFMCRNANDEFSFYIKEKNNFMAVDLIDFIISPKCFILFFCCIFVLELCQN